MAASFVRVQLGIEGIVSTSEKLNHGEHRGGTEDTGESASANRRIGIPSFVRRVNNLQYSCRGG
jgi:hypothetical protein